MKYGGLFFINIICIILIAWISFFPHLYIPVCFKGTASTINGLIETFSIAYVTSFIFYYLVVRIKEKRESKIILTYTANHTYFLINQVRVFVFALQGEAGIIGKKMNLNIHLFTEVDYPSEEDWKEIAKINPNTWRHEEGERIQGFIRIPTFLGDINQKVSNIDYRIDQVFIALHLIDPEYITILSDIKDCHFHREVLAKGNYKSEILKSQFTSLERSIPSMKKYFEAIQKLELYADKHLKKHVNNKALLVIT